MRVDGGREERGGGGGEVEGKWEGVTQTVRSSVAKNKDRRR